LTIITDTGKKIEVRPGEALCGIGIKSFTITSDDVDYEKYPRLNEYIIGNILPRVVPSGF
jgi:hypothetical protein